jgi:hypothetical protein
MISKSFPKLSDVILKIVKYAFLGLQFGLNWSMKALKKSVFVSYPRMLHQMQVSCATGKDVRIIMNTE